MKYRSHEICAGREIRLFLSDVDGSLFTPDHRVTPRAFGAIGLLKKSGIGFSVVSGRPPSALLNLISELGLTLPLAAFNGAMVIRPDLTVIEEHLLDGDTAALVIAALEAEGVDVWLYRGKDWFIKEGSSAHVTHEVANAGFEPTFVGQLDPSLGAAKIVAVSDDPGQLARCEKALRKAFDERVSAQLSQTFYLDVTHPNANKGAVVQTLSRLLSIPTQCFATLGDMANDISMFEVSGLSIAMGNANQEVKEAADLRTKRNDDEGFAYSVESIVLPMALANRSVA